MGLLQFYFYGSGTIFLPTVQSGKRLRMAAADVAIS
jgi:hypothetical protein